MLRDRGERDGENGTPQKGRSFSLNVGHSQEFELKKVLKISELRKDGCRQVSILEQSSNEAWDGPDAKTSIKSRGDKLPDLVCEEVGGSGDFPGLQCGYWGVGGILQGGKPGNRASSTEDVSG